MEQATSGVGAVKKGNAAHVDFDHYIATRIYRQYTVQLEGL